ncbi:MAG: ribonuclease HI [Synergistaceae bacterium]|jgi:ribonuclease HI|nr:ribonuclease HI [Synergistaceae bacterium]
MPRDEVVIYTDGGASPNPGLGGWAAVLISPAHGGLERAKEIFGAEPDTTNNRMELRAAVMALSALKRPCSVSLYTDSAYLRNAFERGWLDKWLRNGWLTSEKKPVLNRDLWEELLSLSRIHSVEWIWTKGHSTGGASASLNNRCDALVRLARDRYVLERKGG